MPIDYIIHMKIEDESIDVINNQVAVCNCYIVSQSCW